MARDSSRVWKPHGFAKAPSIVGECTGISQPRSCAKNGKRARARERYKPSGSAIHRAKSGTGDGENSGPLWANIHGLRSHDAKRATLAVDFMHRGLTKASSVAAFPTRIIRGAWRAIGLPSKRVSVRRIGMRNALTFEGRIPLGEIVAGIVIEQSVVAMQNGLSAVALSFGICRRINRCTLEVSVIDAHGAVVRETAILCETLPDNRPYRFDFEPLPDSEGTSYRVRIASFPTPASAMYGDGMEPANQKFARIDLQRQADRRR